MKEVQYILGYIIMNYKLTLDKPIDNIINYRKGNIGTINMTPNIGVKIQKL